MYNLFYATFSALLQSVCIYIDYGDSGLSLNDTADLEDMPPGATQPALLRA